MKYLVTFKLCWEVEVLADSSCLVDLSQPMVVVTLGLCCRLMLEEIG